MNNLHGILIAFNSGEELRELAKNRNTASLPYGCRYRTIDFMLSNLVNAGVTDVGLLVSEKYQSLLDHVGSGKNWDLARKHGGLRVLPPYSYERVVTPGKIGAMTALRRITQYLDMIRQDYVLLGNADIICNLPVQQILEEHIRSGADVTAICTEHYNSMPSRCNYITVGTDGLVKEIHFNPSEAKGLELFNIYILSTELLRTMVEDSAEEDIDRFIAVLQRRLNRGLRIRPHCVQSYATQIKTVQQYYERSMDLLSEDVRRQLFRTDRPIRTKDFSNPSTYYAPGSSCRCSLIADGCMIMGTVENSLLFRNVRIGEGAIVRNSILMQGTVIEPGAEIVHVIADKNVRVKANHQLISSKAYPIAVEKGAVI